MATIFHKSLAKDKDSIARRGLTFAAATGSLIAAFAAAAIAIPMMAVWRTDLGLSESETAMTVVSYFAGCVLTLFFFARLSNFFGRKPIVLASLFLGIASSLIYAEAQGAQAIYIGRFLQGFSCGFASSAAMSWVVDSAPQNRPWLGTALTAADPNIGLSLGTLISGAVLESGLMTSSALFDCAVVMLALCAVLVFISTETMRFASESLGSVFIPKIAVPQRLRFRFFASSIAFIGTWGVGSFLQGFSAYLSAVVFGFTNAMLAAILYLVLIVRFLLSDTNIAERAGVISALYLSAYVGSVTPNLVIACIPGEVTQTMIAAGFYCWVIACCAGVLFFLRKAR